MNESDMSTIMPYVNANMKQIDAESAVKVNNVTHLRRILSKIDRTPSMHLHIFLEYSVNKKLYTELVRRGFRVSFNDKLDRECGCCDSSDFCRGCMP